MCTVHRNRKLSIRYIRNVYWAQKHKTFKALYQKCVLCSEKEHFPDGTTEMCTMKAYKILVGKYMWKRLGLRITQKRM